MKWLNDKEKRGEIYTNSENLYFCLKCFKKEKRVELWINLNKGTFGYTKIFPTEANALLTYRMIKGLNLEDIIPYAEKHLELFK